MWTLHTELLVDDQNIQSIERCNFRLSHTLQSSQRSNGAVNYLKQPTSQKLQQRLIWFPAFHVMCELTAHSSWNDKVSVQISCEHRSTKNNQHQDREKAGRENHLAMVRRVTRISLPLWPIPSRKLLSFYIRLSSVSFWPLRLQNIPHPVNLPSVNRWVHQDELLTFQPIDLNRTFSPICTFPTALNFRISVATNPNKLNDKAKS